jgi:DNA (cytosine-5)-methyltransferase 1
MSKPIKIIDLFAGPGGLGEGFSNCTENSPFEIVVSVEYEANAHKTLTLRSFFRKLKTKQQLEDYYTYIKSTTQTEKVRNKELMIQNNKELWEQACHETLGEPHALGNAKKWKKIKNSIPLEDTDHEDTPHETTIFSRIENIRKSHDGPLIVIGGPPCQAYSVNGRNRIQAEKDYKPENDERFFLYQEYLRVLDTAKPDLFVMENVEGISSAKLATGELIFTRIKRELTRPDNEINERYDIYSLACKPHVASSETDGPIYKSNKDYVIKASNYGVPQGRKRVILLGIKRKHGLIDKFMAPNSEAPCNISELIGLLPKIRSGMSGQSSNSQNEAQWLESWATNKQSLFNVLNDKKEISNLAHKKALLVAGNKKLSNDEKTKIVNNYRAEITGAFAKTAIELDKFEKPMDFATHGMGNDLFVNCTQNTFTVELISKQPELFEWLHCDHKIGGVANHRSRRHLQSDLLRYMFSASWAKAHSQNTSPSPRSQDFPKALTPAHGNWNTGHHADRFRTIEANQVPHTITSHLRKDGHAQIHFDVSQNRSMTVREAARIQTFPDNYYFEGSQGWQFQQVGNAVPPFLAKKIALHVLEIMKDKELV